jgi:hypothetical protein
MADNNTVPVNEKNFVGIGKLLFDTYGVEWNIPHLHFMVDKTPQGHFEATNLEFGLVSSGKTHVKAIQHLAALTHFHVLSVMKDGNGYTEFKESVKSRAMDDYWAVYREKGFSNLSGRSHPSSPAKHLPIKTDRNSIALGLGGSWTQINGQTYIKYRALSNTQNPRRR